MSIETHLCTHTSTESSRNLTDVEVAITTTPEEN